MKGWLPFTSQRGLNQVLFEPCKMVAHHTALQPKLPISCVAWWIPSLSSKKRLILCKQASKQASKLPTLCTCFSPPIKQRCCSNRFFRMMKTASSAVRFRHSAGRMNRRAGRNAFRKQQAAFYLKCPALPVKRGSEA